MKTSQTRHVRPASVSVAIVLFANLTPHATVVAVVLCGWRISEGATEELAAAMYRTAAVAQFRNALAV